MGKEQPLDHLTLEVRLTLEVEVSIWVVLQISSGTKYLSFSVAALT